MHSLPVRQTGSRVAYRAVMRPVEGTILTVVREAADYTHAYAMDQEDVSWRRSGEDARRVQGVAERTPELLPVLAEAGVDSGMWTARSLRLSSACAVR
ncbi:MAG: DAK2 domain-containing protein [Merdibacter sp.]